MRQASASAPARANLIGEHTDYNSGYVFPTVLPFRTSVTAQVNEQVTQRVAITSTNFAKPHTRGYDEGREGHWSDYVLGCIYVLRERGYDIPSLSLEISSNIPMGAGISSSAALSVATLRALRSVLDFDLSDEDIALLAHTAEHDFVGVPCGKMDQFVCSLGKPGYAFLLDTQAMTYRDVPLFPDVEVMLVNCGHAHALAKGGGYRQRVAECHEACKLLGIESLRELDTKDLDRLKSLPDVIACRARHIITENQRVLDSVKALEARDMAKMSKLMAASHVSMRDDYQISIPEIDRLVESSNRFGVEACRLTGGGFGGSIVALVPSDQTREWWSFVAKENPKSFLISTYGLKEKEGIA